MSWDFNDDLPKGSERIIDCYVSSLNRVGNTGGKFSDSTLVITSNDGKINQMSVFPLPYVYKPAQRIDLRNVSTLHCLYGMVFVEIRNRVKGLTSQGVYCWVIADIIKYTHCGIGDLTRYILDFNNEHTLTPPNSKEEILKRYGHKQF